MPTLTIVVGLPGAGKSTYCKRYAPNGRHFGDVCHPSRTAGPGSLGEVVMLLRDGIDCLIEDVSFCEPAQRERVSAWVRRMLPNVEVSFRWIFIENDPRKCLTNLVADFLNDLPKPLDKKRDHPGRFACFFGLVNGNVYKIPDGAQVEPVVSRYVLIDSQMI